MIQESMEIELKQPELVSTVQESQPRKETVLKGIVRTVKKGYENWYYAEVEVSYGWERGADRSTFSIPKDEIDKWHPGQEVCVILRDNTYIPITKE